MIGKLPPTSKEGHISQFLVRPIDYLSYRLCLFLSGRLVFTCAAAGPILAFLVWQHDFLLWPADLTTFACFLLSLVLSALLQFFMSYVMAMLAFWVLEISSFIFALLACQRLLGGQMFPIDILPKGNREYSLVHSVPLPIFFPRQHLLGPADRKRAGARIVHSTRLGRAGLVSGAFLLGARPAQLCSGGRLKAWIPNPKIELWLEPRPIGSRWIFPESAPSRFSAKPLRYAEVYCALVKNSVTRDLTFKINFFFWILVELLWFALQLAFNDVIYGQTESIGTWVEWEVVMLIGASHFIQQLFQALFLVNCTVLSDLVHSGKFDFLLLFPMNTRFLVSCRQIDLSGFVGAACGLGVVVYAAQQLHLSPSFTQVSGFALLCVAAILVHYSLMFLMATTSFWTVRAQGIMMAYYNLFSIARLPDVIFRGTSKVIFTLAIPMLLVSNVPVKVLAKKLDSPAEIVLLLVMSVICFLFSKLIWHIALRHYTSASS